MKLSSFGLSLLVTYLLNWLVECNSFLLDSDLHLYGIELNFSLVCVNDVHKRDFHELKKYSLSLSVPSSDSLITIHSFFLPFFLTYFLSYYLHNVRVCLSSWGHICVEHSLLSSDSLIIIHHISFYLLACAPLYVFLILLALPPSHSLIIIILYSFLFCFCFSNRFQTQQSIVLVLLLLLLATLHTFLHIQ